MTQRQDIKMDVKFSRKFRKQYNKASRKIQSEFDRRLKLFLQDQFHPLLNNHSLTSNLKGYRSINITGDWRAIFSEYEEIERRVIVFEILGTHSEIYR